MKKKKTQRTPVRKWKLPIAFTLRLIIDITTALVLTTTTYIGIFNKDIFFLIITVSIILSYLIFIYKGFYSMRVEMRNKNITLVSFPFARIPIPYKKIKSAEITYRKWGDYLTGYGCKLNKKNDEGELYFRSMMRGEAVVIKLRDYKEIRKVEITLDTPKEFVEELKKRLRK